MDLKTRLKRIFKTLFWANMALTIIIRAVYGGRMVITPDGGFDTGVAIYRIAGVNSNPRHAFRLIRLPEEGLIYDVSYSPLGFWSGTASSQLENHIIKSGASKVDIYTISIGTKVAQGINEEIYNEATTVAINPYSSLRSLRADWRSLEPAVAVTAEVVTLPLGVFGLLPVIPAETGHYSAVLWADLLLAASSDSSPLNSGADMAIWSRDDEMLDKASFDAQFEHAATAEVATNHARIGDEILSRLYQEAIDDAWNEYLKKAPM